MAIIELTDRDRIARFLRREPERNIYALGDLDDFYWPHTDWYGLEVDHPFGDDAANPGESAPYRDRGTGKKLAAVVLVYHGPQVSTVHCLQSDTDPAAELLPHVLDKLPQRFEAHATPTLATVLRTHRRIVSQAEHLKLSLTAPRLTPSTDPEVKQLSPRDSRAAEALYAESYPGNWFDPRMLQTGRYYGIWKHDQLVSIAGVHVYSKEYGVAAIGNVTTSPEYRRRGLGTRVTSVLARTLLDEGMRVGLNVRADNLAALSCYSALGFETETSYVELSLG
jgi:ribosomal protein S18 acetylase RimI-like enzyme